jgi:chromosome partitioning protein
MQPSLNIPSSRPWYPARGTPCTADPAHQPSPADPIATHGVVHGVPARLPERRKMKTIAFVNKKGGVGKSSCVLHIGGALAKRGISTLVCDVDPQASLSQGLMSRPDLLAMSPRDTISALFEEDGSASIRDLIRDVGIPNLGLLPGHDRMTAFNVPFPWTTGEAQYILRDALADVADDWSVCLLDCPPHIQACAWSALVAADAVVLPAQLEDFGIQGVSAIMDSIDHARGTANPRLALLGLLGTMVNPRLKIHIDYAADLRAAYGDDVFDAVVPMSTDYKVAVTARKTIVEFKPRSAAAKAIEAVTDEMLARFDARCGAVHGVPSDLGTERIGA